LTLPFKVSNLASLRLYDALLLPLTYLISDSLTGFIESAFDLANAQTAINSLQAKSIRLSNTYSISTREGLRYGFLK
jgi:hypothetical protein